MIYVRNLYIKYNTLSTSGDLLEFSYIFSSRIIPNLSTLDIFYIYAQAKYIYKYTYMHI